MLEIFEGPFQDYDNKPKALYPRLWLSEEARDTLMEIKNWETLDRNNPHHIPQTSKGTGQINLIGTLQDTKFGISGSRKMSQLICTYPELTLFF